jgi:acetoin utilization deacetylase AcuC-like enzyme
VDTAIVWSKDYELHDTGGHPEGPDRATQIVTHLQSLDLWTSLTVVPPVPATVDDILLVHTEALVDRVRRIAEGGGGEMDHETPVSARSFEIALLAAGGALTALGQWEQDRVPFALVRPPGHHATPDRSMGFCLFNNVAIAARTLLARGMERVAIVDWDVHHGNGTQAAFYDEPRVLFCSLHQWPLYPGSGWFNECGDGEGEGFTVNLPLPVGCRDGDYVQALEQVVEPIVEQFAPQAILVSAGFDPHADEPLASLQLSENGFAALALRLLALAQRRAEGRLALVLEGGYDRPATNRSVAAVLAAISSEQAPAVTASAGAAQAAIERAREVQSIYWQL